MLIRYTIPFVDNTATLPKSAETHQEQQGISITMPTRQQLYIHIFSIPPRSSCSAAHNASSVVRLLSINEMSIIVEANNQRTISMQPTAPFLARLKLRGYRQMAGRFRPISVWPPITSHYYQTGLSHITGLQLSAILILINSGLSTLVGFGASASTSESGLGTLC